MSKQVSRRRFLTATGAIIAVAAAEPAIADAASSRSRSRSQSKSQSRSRSQSESGSEPNRDLTPAQALRRLTAGNRRWVTGRVAHPHQSVARREALSHVQHPFATVVSCIDSRVPPELVFDRGIGDLAVMRTGAQVLDRGVVMGSIEFSVAALHTPLILVMGHQRCGAVKSAIEVIQTGDSAPAYIQSIVDALRPAYAVAVRQPGDLLDNMIRAQTRLAVARIKADPLIRGPLAHGKVGVRGAYYSLDSGKASIIV
jgi:carbonic anhydrase